jgi:platelet-activating factor acetylhydrolase IB subunit alpha
MILTDRERDKLHRAILAYLWSQRLNSAARALQDQGVTADDTPPDLLEKKWSSVVRLQQKVMTMQNELAQLKEEMTYFGPGKKLSDSNGSKFDGLPRVPEKHSLTGHRESVTCAVFHPVFSILVTASEDGSIRLWDYESGVFERTLKGHTATVNYIAIEPNTGQVLASASADLTIKLWDFQTFECVRTLNGHDHNVSCVEFLPAGDFLVSSSRDCSVKLWETNTGYCVKTFRGHDEWVRRVVVNVQGNLLATCSNDETVRIWTLDNTAPAQTLTGHSNVVECVAFANSTAVKTLHSENGGSPEEEKTSASRQAEIVASGSRDKSIKLWDVWSGSCLATLNGHDNWVRGVAFHPSGKFLYSCSDDKSIRVWDNATSRCHKKLLDAHSHFVTCLAVNLRFPMMASGSVDKSVKVWECR